MLSSWHSISCHQEGFPEYLHQDSVNPEIFPDWHLVCLSARPCDFLRIVNLEDASARALICLSVSVSLSHPPHTHVFAYYLDELVQFPLVSQRVWFSLGLGSE